MPRIPSRPPLDLSGKWAVVELPSMTDDYLDLTPDPHVLITHTEFERFSATFQFGAQQGEIDGRVDEIWTELQRQGDKPMTTREAADAYIALRAKHDVAEAAAKMLAEYPELTPSLLVD